MDTTQLNTKANIPADITFISDMITVIIIAMTTTDNDAYYPDYE